MSVKVYSTNTCPLCKKAKEYLKSKKVEFQEVNVAVDRMGAMEMVRKSGQSGVPVIDINGNIIIGFDQVKIDKLIS